MHSLALETNARTVINFTPGNISILAIATAQEFNTDILSPSLKILTNITATLVAALLKQQISSELIFSKYTRTK